MVLLGKAIDYKDQLYRTIYPLSLVGDARRVELANGHSIAPTAAVAQSLALFLDVDYRDDTLAT